MDGEVLYRHVMGNPSEPDIRRTLRAYMRAWACRQQIEGKKILRVGEPPEGFSFGEIEETALKAQFGMTLQKTPLEEMFARAKAIPENALAGYLAEAAEKDTITMVGAFTVTYDKLPADYAMTVVTDTEMEYEAIFTSEDAKKPMIDLLMCFSDEWSGVETWADATPEDVEAVKESFYEVTEMDDGDITFEDSTTGKGTPILIAKGADGSFAAAYATLYE